MWDTRESLSQHHQVTEDHSLVARSATYANTEAHHTRITSIRHLASGHSDHDPAAVQLQQAGGGHQLVSLEQCGQLVVWTVLDHQADYEHHLGLAHWGQARMVASSVINLSSLLMAADLHESDEVQSYDIAMDPLDQSR